MLTNSSVDILLNSSDNIAIKYIETPDGKLITNNTLTYTVYEDGTYTFKVVDLAGNEVVKSITLNNIDSVNPILATELSNADWSNEALTLNICAISDKGIKYIELPNGSKIEESIAQYSITENGVYIVTTESLGGNVTTEQVVVKNIDTEVPSLTLVPSTEEWSNKDIHITVKAEDNIGIDYIILPNGQIIHKSHYTYSVSSNGSYKFTAVDLAGNQYTQSIEISNIDKQTPIIDNHDKIISVLYNIITLDISHITTSSGIYKIILPDKKEIIKPTEEVIEFKVSNNGIYKFVVVDNAGNNLDINVPVHSFKDESSHNINGTNNAQPNYHSNLPSTGGLYVVTNLLYTVTVGVGYMLIHKKQ